MSDFVFFELQPEVRREMRLPPHPIPVRRDRQQQVFLPGGQVDFPAMLEEVRLFLDENPALEGDYAHVVAMLAYISGLDAASRGFHEQAMHIYEMGLDAVPESVSLRSHYALALQCLGRSVEARREIEEVIARTPKDKILPVLWMVLARIYARDGEYEKAYWLLKDVSTLIPEEPGFWDFLGEMEERAGLKPAPARPPAPPEPEFTVNVGATLRAGDFAAPGVPRAPEASPAPPTWRAPPVPSAPATTGAPQAYAGPARAPRPDAEPACARCRSVLVPNAKFCLKCGTPVPLPAPSAPPPAFVAPPPGLCPKCRTDLTPGAKFCRACGARVDAAPAAAPAPPRQLACTGCGTALAPGTKFCVTCGTRAA